MFKLSKKFFVIIGLCLASSVTVADVGFFCGDIKRMRVWENGSDAYGIWIEYNTNPSQCSGGFYLANQSNNKDHVFSLALAAKSAGQRVCIQGITNQVIGNRCRVNYLMHE